MRTEASRDVLTMGGGDKKREFELPALKLAQLLNCRDIELEGLGIEYVNTKAEDGESTFHAALIAEVIDGRTVDCVPLTSCEDLDSRVDDEEARKVPSVILSLKVPSKTYVDLESPPQSETG
ncbi:uncharacterized protein EMH_0000610 [Eimeria mitis]|uniref:Uncharacterized protein n=1 Tax=Eimeria mitis TaxID=44415 RepID=U6KCV0_9EIME|nr:uncharacterized protein EMH_0000610 [Eimeria mitis]CDJ35825.1 hypothetical protein EMH_0000610 [Eimeria mitis]